MPSCAHHRGGGLNEEKPKEYGDVRGATGAGMAMIAAHVAFGKNARTAKTMPMTDTQDDSAKIYESGLDAGTDGNRQGRVFVRFVADVVAQMCRCQVFCLDLSFAFQGPSALKYGGYREHQGCEQRHRGTRRKVGVERKVEADYRGGRSNERADDHDAYKAPCQEVASRCGCDEHGHD